MTTFLKDLIKKIQRKYRHYKMIRGIKARLPNRNKPFKVDSNPERLKFRQELMASHPNIKTVEFVILKQRSPKIGTLNKQFIEWEYGAEDGLTEEAKSCLIEMNLSFSELSAFNQDLIQYKEKIVPERSQEKVNLYRLNAQGELSYLS